jgi:cleavage and polyadenylation specificity factor subunit 1
MKDYILIADACRSVQFVVWREKDNSLTLLGKDYEHYETLSAGFVVDGDVLGIVVGDTEGNVQLMRYNPRYVSQSK